MLCRSGVALHPKLYLRISRTARIAITLNSPSQTPIPTFIVPLLVLLPAIHLLKSLSAGLAYEAFPRSYNTAAMIAPVLYEPSIPLFRMAPQDRLLVLRKR